VSVYEIIRHGKETASRLASKGSYHRFDFSVAMNGGQFDRHPERLVADLFAIWWDKKKKK